MTWTYSQRSGELLHDHAFEGTGYSGTLYGRDNPAAQETPNIGPIPQGRYTIGAPYSDPHLGPCAMHCDPKPGTDTFGRSLFRIHGDNARHDASHGCIILGPAIREKIAASGDHDLLVTT